MTAEDFDKVGRGVSLSFLKASLGNAVTTVDGRRMMDASNDRNRSLLAFAVVLSASIYVVTATAVTVSYAIPSI